MTKLLALLFILSIGSLWARDKRDGPSSLEGEFSKQANIKLPFVHATIDGLGLDFSFTREDTNQSTTDDLYSDFSGLTVNVGPIAYASRERSKWLINLEDTGRADGIIEPAAENSPYVFIENRRWDLAAGLEAYVSLPLPSSYLGASVAFLRGKNYYSVRRLTHRSEQRAALKLPFDREAVASWRVGDQIIYNTRGGMIYNVFVGMRPFLSIGPEYIHSGSYRLRAHLVAEQLMEIEVLTTSTQSIGLEAVSAAFKMEFSKGRGHMNSLVYRFDLTDPASYKAMATLFHGRLDLTNRQLEVSAGTITVSTSMQHAFSSFSGKFGIPFILILGGSRGTQTSQGTIERTDQGGAHRYQVYNAASVIDTYTTGMLSTKRSYNERISSTILRDELARESVISGIYSWSFSKFRMRGRQLLKRLHRLGELFGKDVLKNITLPSDKLGYVKADFDLNLTGRQVLSLLHTETLKRMHTKARLLCVRFENCGKRDLQKIDRTTEDLLSLSLALDEKYETGKVDEVGLMLVKLMKKLLNSRDLTGAFMELHPDVAFELRLEGEKIKRHTIRL